VYRARDEKLERDVAVKVLPEDLVRDRERLGRFEREAKLLAALNHTNIASIYGLEDSNATPFLVLELVEGENLAQRLERGPIPADDALEIAKQVAEALEEAHEKGIVHRDLKPVGGRTSTFVLSTSSTPGRFPGPKAPGTRSSRPMASGSVSSPGVTCRRSPWREEWPSPSPMRPTIGEAAGARTGTSCWPLGRAPAWASSR
jgi:hypothetical protein